MFLQRQKKLVDALKARDLDALILNPGPSLVYLTGLYFHLSERPVVAIFLRDGRTALILPELEMLKLKNTPYPITDYPYAEDPLKWGSSFLRAIRDLDLDGRVIGVETRQLRLLEFNYFREKAPHANFPDASEIIGTLRLYKDSSEADAMRRAVHVAQMALENTLPLIKAGMTETELAAELTMQLLRKGSQPDALSSPIVSGGPNSANPHAYPGDRKLHSGDLLVIDWGAVVDGYFSDLTRTFAVLEVSQEYEKIHRLVQEANAAGRAVIKPGLPCANVDKAARDVIEQAGFGKFFTHRTGHGLGMEVHEDPYIRGDNDQKLEPGMTFTVEPGIYLPDRGGVRIEDNVLVTQTGVESFSDMPRELRIVG